MRAVALGQKSVDRDPKPPMIISTIPTMHGRSTIEVEPADAAEFSSLERLTEQDSVALRSLSEGPQALSKD